MSTEDFMQRYSPVDAAQDLHLELPEERPVSLSQGSSVAVLWLGAAALGGLLTVFLADEPAPSEAVLLTEDPPEAPSVFAYVPFEIRPPATLPLPLRPQEPAPVIEDFREDFPAPRPSRRKPPRVAPATPLAAPDGELSTAEDAQLPGVEADPTELQIQE